MDYSYSTNQPERMEPRPRRTILFFWPLASYRKKGMEIAICAEDIVAVYPLHAADRSIVGGCASIDVVRGGYSQTFLVGERPTIVRHQWQQALGQAE